MEIATEKVAEVSNVTEKAKDEIETVIHTEKTHTTETHGKDKDINKDTPISEVKAPNLLERAKEEVDAVVETIHSKKKEGCEQPKKEGGFWSFIGKLVERFCCSPKSKKD